MALTLDVARKLPRTKRSKLVFAPTKYVERELLHRYRITELPATTVPDLRSGRPIGHRLSPEHPHMVLKEYQKRTLATVREFLEGLAEWRSRAATILAVDPEMDVDWVRKAWRRAHHHASTSRAGTDWASRCRRSASR